MDPTNIFSIAKRIYDQVQLVKENQEECRVLAETVNNIQGSILGLKGFPEKSHFEESLKKLELELDKGLKFIERLSTLDQITRLAKAEEHRKKIIRLDNELQKLMSGLNASMQVTMLHAIRQMCSLKKDKREQKELNDCVKIVKDFDFSVESIYIESSIVQSTTIVNSEEQKTSADFLQANTNDLRTMSIIEAIKKDDIDGFMSLLKLKKNINGTKFIDEVDKEGKSALHWAVVRNHMHYVKPLVKEGADINKQDNNGATLIYIAVRNGYIKMIKDLIDLKVDVNIPNNGGCTPILIAAQIGSANVIAALLRAEPDVNKSNNKHVTPVWIAAAKGHAEAVAILLEKRANINISCLGLTPIFIATIKGHAAVIKNFKDAGVDVNIPDEEGCDPLTIATYLGHVAVVNSLLEGEYTCSKASLIKALEFAEKGEKKEHQEITQILKLHLIKYSNDIESAKDNKPPISFFAKWCNALKQKSPPHLPSPTRVKIKRLFSRNK